MNNQERIIVLYKPHNTKVSIMRKQFDTQVHEYLDETNNDIPNDRFQELKTKGWAKLNGEERKEYKKLKLDSEA